MMEYELGQRRRRTFLEAILRLIGHLAGAALVFCALFTLGWLIGVLLNWLHSIHPFSDEIFRFIVRLEVWVIYLDAAVSGVVLLAGAIRFIVETLGSMK